MAEVNDKDTLFSSLKRQSQAARTSLIQNAQAEASTELKSIQQEQLEWHRSRRKHREKFDKKIYVLLCIQVGFLMLLMLCQGFRPFGFQLSNWVFGFFINGSLIYTYAIIRYIASDLFNGKHELLKPEKVGTNRQEPIL
ncbi:hypothetical protein GZ77_20440 [Endozoicomonas montiporae]|uniref:2TM domain-containing protein n=2 Tax=Endozoicomonas montiporae TaxID=1027273 RepID=A0A081N300_9GAMM|nr:hypothetical protein [Endozoicomonas montiporae]AMO58093.1 hypothetical protein EZMO1_4169 [Endozoicomonas montiporae CL-33]KEQ12823.1 hypothetical protein GZ77_20440 [Endozoicomonas montiporae]